MYVVGDIARRLVRCLALFHVVACVDHFFAATLFAVFVTFAGRAALARES